MHANLVFLHARRQPFPSFHELAEALHVVWPYGEAACVQEVIERLGERWSHTEKEAAVWKRCADAAAGGHLLVDLAHVQLTRLTPLICLSPDSPPILPDPLPSVLESHDIEEESAVPEAAGAEDNAGQATAPLSTFDDSLLDDKQRAHFLRNLRAVEAVLHGATVRDVAAAEGMGRSTLGRLVQRTVKFGQLACVPHATYQRARALHPAFQQTIRLLYSRPTKLSIQAITEHVELQHIASRLRADTGMAVALPSYDQVRRYILTLQQESQVRQARGEERGSRRARQSPLSFALSIPAPAQLAQVDESREMLGIMEQLRYNGLNHSPATRTRRSACMRVKLQLVMCSDDGQEETVTDVITLNKNNERLEPLGLTLAEAKQLLSTLQRHLLQHQVDTFLDPCSTCPDCGALLKVKAHASRSFRTLFGTYTLHSPRLEHCDCTRRKTASFRPLSALLTESVAPELLSMEAKWSSLVSYGMSLEALKDFLPLEVTLDVKTVRYDTRVI